MQRCFLFKRSQIICRNQQGFSELMTFPDNQLHWEGIGSRDAFSLPVLVETIIGMIARGELSTYLCGLLMFNLEMSLQCFTLSDCKLLKQFMFI